MKQLRKEFVFDAPIGDVWAALTDRRALAEWLMPNDFEPKVGHRFRFQTDPNFVCGDAITVCQVISIDAPHSMVWTWGKMTPEGQELPTKLRIEWSLTAQGTQTRLVLVQTGNETVSLFTRLLMSLGWSGMLKRSLRKVLANIHAGRFTPGAIPLAKRYYKATAIPADLAV